MLLSGRVEAPVSLAPVPSPPIEFAPPVPAPVPPVDPQTTANGIPSPAPPKQPVSQEKIDAAVEEFMKSKIAWRKLPTRMKMMAQAGEFTLRVLMALADKPGRIGTHAVEGLGHAKDPDVLPEVAALLKKKFRDRNVETACAALKSYARVKKDEGVPDLTAYIAANYHRPDGHGERVCTATVQGLGELGTKPSHDALLGQLARVDEPTWLMDYGSSVVKALVRHDEVSAGPAGGGAARPQQGGSFEKVMGKASGKQPAPPPPTPAAGGTPKKTELRGPYKDQTRDALVRYAERLRARLPRVLSPNGKKYVEGKIAEALAARGSE
jgi:hypothetical protein